MQPEVVREGETGRLTIGRCDQREDLTSLRLETDLYCAERYHISESLENALRQDVRYDWELHKCFDVNQMLFSTSPFLRSAIKTELCGSALHRMNLFSGCSRSFKVMLTDSMKVDR